MTQIVHSIPRLFHRLSFQAYDRSGSWRRLLCTSDKEWIVVMIVKEGLDTLKQ